MKKSLLFRGVIVMFASAAVVCVADVGQLDNATSALALNEGDNFISFAVVNDGALRLQGLRTSTSIGALPVGVEVRSSVNTIDVDAQSGSLLRLRIPIHVEKGVRPAAFDLPLQLEDNQGNTWKFHVPATIVHTLPDDYALKDNVPNPFNPSTLISYTIKGDRLEQTRLEIYNSIGQKVRTLVQEQQTAGSYIVEWNGLDDQGRRATSGIYFYRLESGSYLQTKKMVLVE